MREMSDGVRDMVKMKGETVARHAAAGVAYRFTHRGWGIIPPLRAVPEAADSGANSTDLELVKTAMAGRSACRA